MRQSLRVPVDDFRAEPAVESLQGRRWPKIAEMSAANSYIIVELRMTRTIFAPVSIQTNALASTP